MVLKFVRKFATTVDLKNIKLFLFHSRQYGLRYAIWLTLLYLEQRNLIPVSVANLIKNPSYEKWMKNNEPNDVALAHQRNSAALFDYRPKISIVVPVFNTPPHMLRDMIESVINQTYDKWELCIADGNSQESEVQHMLAEQASKYPQIKVITLRENIGIAGNTNEAISISDGEFVGFLDHDDVLAPYALYEIVSYLNEKPDTDFIYTDEDRLSKNGKKRFDPFFKPDWGPTVDTLRSLNFFRHLAVIRRSFLDKIGWLKIGYEGAQDYELILRVIESTDKIGHIEKILYHWRAHGLSTSTGPVKPSAGEAAKKALSDHLARTETHARVESLDDIGRYRIIYDLIGKPLVSIIIPTRDKADVLKTCIDSIVEKNTYTNIEIVIADNQSSDESAIEYLKTVSRTDPRVRVLNYNFPFNYSSINNYAAGQARGDVLLFLNNDMEVISPDWLESMLGHIIRPEVGAVGCKLYYPDNTVQNAGIVMGITNFVGESYKRFARIAHGYKSGLMIDRNVSAVTGACMMIKRETFEEVDGFDEQFQVAYNDVDLCLKIRSKGYLIVWTPFAELYHHESLSRGKPSTKEKWYKEMRERNYLMSKWGTTIQQGDPYYNIHLNQSSADFTLNVAWK